MFRALSKNAKTDIHSPKALMEKIFNQRYKNFTLPGAHIIYDDFKIQEGYTVSPLYFFAKIKRIKVNVSAERVFDIFDRFVSLVGYMGTVVLMETWPKTQQVIGYLSKPKEVYLIRSVLLNHKEAILNNGYIGIVIYDRDKKTEVQLTDHKNIIIYTGNAKPFFQVLDEEKIRKRFRMKFVEDFHHSHLRNYSTTKSMDYLFKDLDFKMIKVRTRVDKKFV